MEKSLLIFKFEEMNGYFEHLSELHVPNAYSYYKKVNNIIKTVRKTDAKDKKRLDDLGDEYTRLISIMYSLDGQNFQLRAKTDVRRESRLKRFLKKIKRKIWRRT